MLRAIKEYILTCFRGEHTDYSWDDNAISLRAEACDPILYRYTDGDSLRQFVFIVGFREPISAFYVDAEAFYEHLTMWLQQGLPSLSPGQTPQRFEVVKTAAVEKQRYAETQYELVCRLIYYQEGA